MDHRVYGICSDGDLMEGVGAEAASLAGHLGLGRIVYIYDDNRITIDGSTDLAFSGEDKWRLAFAAYGWHTLSVEDANDLTALEAALRAPQPRRGALAGQGALGDRLARSERGRRPPELTARPWGNEEARETKLALGLDPDEHFAVPDSVYEHMDQRPRGRELEAVVCWSGMCGLGSLETDLLDTRNMPKFGQNLGSLEA